MDSAILLSESRNEIEWFLLPAVWRLFYFFFFFGKSINLVTFFLSCSTTSFSFIEQGMTFLWVLFSFHRPQITVKAQRGIFQAKYTCKIFSRNFFFKNIMVLLRSSNFGIKSLFQFFGAFLTSNFSLLKSVSSKRIHFI